MLTGHPLITCTFSWPTPLLQRINQETTILCKPFKQLLHKEQPSKFFWEPLLYKSFFWEGGGGDGGYEINLKEEKKDIVEF